MLDIKVTLLDRVIKKLITLLINSNLIAECTSKLVAKDVFIKCFFHCVMVLKPVQQIH